ncbi:immunity protein Imm33 domain-containing protein [Pseudoduganella sp. R-43]|uniref:immunity protein Imm33 domain-containing protein n=1 Tax=unclassified Pseudoduganella TaxID=2637179 RepID=UPI003CF4C74D
MEHQTPLPNVDDYLFGRGLTLADYYIEQTPVSEMLCYRDANGRDFDLQINDAQLAAAVLTRLKGLGVRIVRLGGVESIETTDAGARQQFESRTAAEITQAYIGQQPFAVKAAPSLKGQVAWLISLFQDMHAQGRPIVAGQRIQLGFSMLTVGQSPDGTLTLWEPDFERNPFVDLREGVDVTLALLSQQTGFIRRANCASAEISFQDKIVLARGALQAPSIYLERSAPNPEKHDSGWFIGIRNSNAEFELEAIYAFQLIQLRPALLEVLALPAGFMVFIEGNQIMDVANEHNQAIEILPAPIAAGVSK